MHTTFYSRGTRSILQRPVCYVFILAIDGSHQALVPELNTKSLIGFHVSFLRDAISILIVFNIKLDLICVKVLT